MQCANRSFWPLVSKYTISGLCSIRGITVYRYCACKFTKENCSTCSRYMSSQLIAGRNSSSLFDAYIHISLSYHLTMLLGNKGNTMRYKFCKSRKFIIVVTSNLFSCYTSEKTLYKTFIFQLILQQSCSWDLPYYLIIDSLCLFNKLFSINYRYFPITEVSLFENFWRSFRIWFKFL